MNNFEKSLQEKKEREREKKERKMNGQFGAE